jgi:hypothetical protein
VAAVLAVFAPVTPAAATGLQLPIVPQSQTERPPGYRTNALDAARIADRVPEVRRERRARPLARGAFLFGDYEWLVRYQQGGKDWVEVKIDGRTGRVEEVWTGLAIGWPLARGEHGPSARRLHLLMVIAGLAFLAPFVNPRKLLRLRHLDLLALLSFGVCQYFYARGNVNAAVPLAYPPLLYLLCRLALVALRPRPDPDPLLPWLSPRALAWALLVVLVLRYVYDATASGVSDVGYASAFGADSILHGYPLYSSSPTSGHLDTYGPIAYLVYVPFELIWPLTNLQHAHADAARAAAIFFDLATVLGLVLLGRRLRPGRDGRALGVALGWGYAAYPWTLYVLHENTNDGLVAMLLVYVLLVAHHPAGRGAVLGLAAASKFAPLALAGVFARVGRERGIRPLLLYGGALAGTIALVVYAYLPPGGLRVFWDSTLGFQLSRTSPFSIWTLHPTWQHVHTPVTALVAAVALAVLFVPRERSLPRLAAAGAVVIIAAQLVARHWWHFYLPWFLPYALVALFSLSYASSVRKSGSSSSSVLASNTS